MNMKLCDIWIGVNTPPPGLHIKQQSGKSVPSKNLVSVIQAHSHEVSTILGLNGTQMVPFPPA